jgi:hypothetical protein
MIPMNLKLNVRNFISFIAIFVLCYSFPPAVTNPSGKDGFTRRFVYITVVPTNNSDVDRILNVLDRAAASGYNGVVIASNQFNIQDPNPLYRGNIEKIVNKSKELGLAVIPTYFGQNSPLSDLGADGINDLAEAFPVVGTNFAVEKAIPVNEARVYANPDIRYPNQGFEFWGFDNKPLDLSIDRNCVYRDREIKHVGNYSVRMQNSSMTKGLCRLYNTQSIKVPNYRAYEISFWIKTEAFSKPGKVGITVLGVNGIEGRLYSKPGSLGIEPTQDWTEYKVTFNTLEQSGIRIYLGIWENASGKIWFDDVELKEIGLNKTIKRPSMPVRVTSEDGGMIFNEGTDFIVGDNKLTIPAGSAINLGDKLKVSWFQYADIVPGGVPASACQELFYTQMKKDVERLDELFQQPYGFMIAYSEWRVGNWDPACREINGGKEMTAGQYLVYALKRAESVIKSVRPVAQIYVWSDMFDPYHHAVANYYSFRGSAERSWEGISPDVTVMNWNSLADGDEGTGKSKSLSSLEFFNSRNNKQILAGYYDQQDFSIDKRFLSNLSDLVNPTGIEGYMYTTWANYASGCPCGNYENIEAVANLLKSQGRWGTNSLLAPLRLFP